MFNYSYNENNTKEELKTFAESLNKSGCFKFKIKEATLRNGSNGSKSEGIRLKFENDEYQMTTDIWYLNKDGNEIEFNGKAINKIKLDQLVALTKTKNNIGAIQTKTNSYGVEEKHLMSLEDKEIGVFVKFKGITFEEFQGKEIKKYNYNIDGFFDVNSRKTTAEIINNLKAEEYIKKEKFYNKLNEKGYDTQINTSNNKNSDFIIDIEDNDNDIFPF